MKPKTPRSPNLLTPEGGDISTLTRYQKGWKTASGEKGYLTTDYFNEDDLIPHKDHFHTKDGAKVFMGEGTKDKPVISEPPTEEDVMAETVNKQRELQQRARRKMGSANTMLQAGSGGPYNRSNRLV